ncbi:HEAT repeat domain-containing protein [Algisphaera agarilytica]|uniref:Sigma-54 factor interaction domain-containing protein n=1 Tax=Algisphaera agarilytica TaxID=1385975 RepID=A0A7X0H7T8_9BACT|nr:HEAT repeat domain-containing protein [Algisphaera agarilytica]MBB6429400.1 hypothetical protein [Algisphaera agarilytica]
MTRLLGLCVGLLGLTAAQAQDEQPAGPQALVQMELLLGSDRVMSESVSGTVWDVNPTAGRRLVQLPMRILPGEAGAGEMVLEEPALSFQGGRFLFWEIPDDQSTGSRGRTSEPVGPTDEELLDLEYLLTRGSDVDDRRGLDAGGDEGSGQSEVPEIAPRLARELFISQAGGVTRVAWEVARGFPGGVVKNGGEDQPYSLLLDRAQLEELEPERPERLTRNADESSREFTYRKRLADAEYRELAGTYRDLQKMVRALPDRFEQDLPETVWAVFEVNALASGWTLRGHESGPWTMDFDDWELLTTLASGRGGGRNASGEGDYSTEELTQIRQLAAMAGDPHPWTQRLLATAVAQSEFPGKAAPDDVVSKLLEKMLQSPDTLARNRTVYALAQVEPATPAVSQVLAASARETRDPAIQLAALRAELSLQLADAAPSRNGEATGDGVSGAINSVNAMLSDEDGADAGLVVEQFLVTIPDDEQTVTAVISGVRFDNLPKPRFDAAVAAVLRSAGEQPEVVGGWVNLQLLGSNDPSVVSRTLDLLARADEPAPILTPLARGLSGMVFRESESAEDAPLDLMITSGIPLDSANHSLFRLLNSGDPLLRKKGWLVLRHFELTDRPTSGSRRSNPATEADDSDPLAMIVDAGLSDPRSTPSSLVSFLARQSDAARADGSLLRVVVEGDQPASRHAARVLRGSERSFDTALREMEPDARETFANRVYEALGDGPEPVTGLMRDEAGGGRGGVIGWFAQELAAGELPDPSAWGEAAGGERNLMQAAVATDEQLAAGAFAALTAMAGGDRELQYKMFERFKDDRKTKTSDSMVEAWVDARKDIYTQRLRSAAGDYRLVMIVTGLAPAEGGVGRASDPILGSDPSVAQARAEGAAVVETSERTTLGVTRLIADGRAIRFSSGTPELGVPEDQLAIRITTPSQLKAFEVQQIKDLPLEESDEPLDLFPQDQGVWRGTMILRDGRDFELVMEPWGGADKSGTDDKKKSPTSGGSDLKNNPFN